MHRPWKSVERLEQVRAVRDILPIWESVYPHDPRPRRAVRVAEEFARGRLLPYQLWRKSIKLRCTPEYISVNTPRRLKAAWCVGQAAKHLTEINLSEVAVNGLIEDAYWWWGEAVPRRLIGPLIAEIVWTIRSVWQRVRLTFWKVSWIVRDTFRTALRAR